MTAALANLSKTVRIDTGKLATQARNYGVEVCTCDVLMLTAASM